MALVTLPNVDSKFATGQPAYGTDITGNVNALLADYNGNITNANCSASMALADSKLAQITTAGKVHTSALTGTILNGSIEAVIDNGGTPILAGAKIDLEIPFACTITSSKMFFDTTSETKVDIWVDTYANFPPTIADTIIATDLFTTVGATATKFTATLDHWDTALVAGDIVRFNVESNTLATRILISLSITRT
jgi:hypothetical protein